MSFRINPTVANDCAMAGLVVAVVALIVLPIPTWLLDALIAVNLAVSVLLLMVALFVPNAVALSTFPSLLLVTTLFRLSLNISSTKAILLTADGGHLIESFGQLVVGGNFVVGVVVFIIITIVQFIVISKGSERVAEVGARFTLDAMPGKQMSIDADLRAGLLTADEAKRKRAHLGMESAMHGGMDGAMKFVKGDTIAGLIMTVINIVAGIIVGTMYHAMTAGEAANRFAVLSIGDAMVSQIPALFICMAAGVLVTRVADDGAKKETSMGQDIVAQLTRNPRALQLAGGLTLSFALVPGFPVIPFVLLAGIFFGTAHVLSKKAKIAEGSAVSKPINALLREGSKGEAPSILQRPPTIARPLAVRLTPELSAMLSAERLEESVDAERQRLQAELGLPFPGSAMWVDAQRTGLAFEVLVHDVPASRVEVPGRQLLVVDPQSPLAANATVMGPALGRRESLWLAPEAVPAAQRGDCLDLEAVIAREMFCVLQRQAHLLMGVQDVQWVIERVTTEFPGLVAEVQKVMPLQRIAEVLRRLLEEQVSIRNLRTIFESLIVWGPKEKDILLLTEYVRGDLGRYLAYEAAAGGRQLQAVLLDPSVEQGIRQCIKPTPAGNFLAMAPDQVATLTSKIAIVAGETPQPGVAVVTSMDIRRYVKKMLEGRAGLEWLRVYSFQELGNLVELKPIGRIG